MLLRLSSIINKNSPFMIPLLRSSFCSQALPKWQYKVANIQSKQDFIKHFTDEQLQHLTKHRYSFEDALKISSDLLQHHKTEGLTDSQVTYLMLVGTLYHNRTKEDPRYAEAVKVSLKNKLKNENYEITPKKIQNDFFELAKVYMSRISDPSTRNDLCLSMFELVCAKYDLTNSSGQWVATNDPAVLDRWYNAVPFLTPAQKSQAKFDSLIEFTYLLLKNQLSVFEQSKQQAAQQGMQSVFSRVRKLREVILELTSDNKKPVISGFFKNLPTSFRTESHFVAFMRILRDLMGSRLITVVEHTELINYHEKLSQQNSKYKSLQSVQAVDTYFSCVQAPKFYPLFTTFQSYYAQQ